MKISASNAILSRPECMALLGSAGLGRIATTESALPVIVPVQYQTLDDNKILFCAGEQPFRLVQPVDSIIAFEAGGLHPLERSGWTVQVRGLTHPYEPDDRAFDHCVRRRLEAGYTYGLLDARDITGHRYDLCGLHVEPHDS